MGKHKHKNRGRSPKRSSNNPKPQHPLYIQALDNFRVNIRPLPAHPPVPTNVVYTVYLEHRQDLTKLPNEMLNVKRNSTHFSSCNIKILNPTGTVLLFESGKLVCVGAMTPCIGYYALMWMRLRLLEYGAQCEFNNPSINNIVMVNDLGHSLHMADFVAHNEESCHYVPKKFSGCTFSATPGGGAGLDLELDLLGLIEHLNGFSLVPPESYIIEEGKPAQKKGVIFETGKYNVMGVTSYEDAFKLSEEIRRRVSDFECPPRTNRKRVVHQREEELVQARLRYKTKLAMFVHW